MPTMSTREEYVARINRVLDYIEENIDGDLTLDTLAGKASFSRFHFHRIFRAMVGETLNRFIQRIRIEKAAAQLFANPKKSITEIALDCGFSGSAAFARAFREEFGMSASDWRKKGSLSESKIGKTISNTGQLSGNIRKDISVSSMYVNGVTQTLTWRITMNKKPETTVEVKTLPETHAAYIRHIGPYKGDSALFESLFTRLMKWAGPRGLLRFPETQVMAVYHDNPDITDEEKLRTSACISVPPDTPVDGEIGLMTIPGGTYAVTRFELLPHEYEEAWDTVCGSWMPESGYQPADTPCFEIYRNDPKEHPEGKHIVDICVPVKPL